jgi:hypothetical protein
MLAEFKSNHIPIVNATSSARGEWSRGLSPFILGPVKLYSNYTALRMENGHQFSKVYKQHTDAQGNPIPAYFKWAKKGWASDRAVRYPMGKGAKPEYVWWNEEKLDYITSRKKVYVPLYVRCVVPSEAYRKLKDLQGSNKDIVLWDFDGYDYIGLNKRLCEVLNDPTRIMGHAFILAMLLTLNREQILEALKV